MEFEDIFLMCDELKSIEREISRVSTLSDENPSDINLQNNLSNIINEKRII